jgi:hypothetical protein
MGVILTAHYLFSYKPPWHGEGKAIPVQTWKGPEGSRKLRLPDSKTVGIRKWKICQSYALAVLANQEIFLVLILFRAEWTPGPYSDQKNYVNEKFQCTS